jgi:hypothetical protein
MIVIAIRVANFSLVKARLFKGGDSFIIRELRGR